VARSRPSEERVHHRFFAVALVHPATAVLALVAIGLVLAAAAPAAAGDSYVALGDSYSSGVGRVDRAERDELPAEFVDKQLGQHDHKRERTGLERDPPASESAATEKFDQRARSSLPRVIGGRGAR
jgi:hypothetical protein